MKPYYEKIRDAADGAALAFSGVAESCRGNKTPLDTAKALRQASLALQNMAEQFESMYDELSRGGQ